MKRYENAMEHLNFRESFVEEAVLKAKNTKRTPHKRLITTVCICLCSVLLFTTALAVSSPLRSLFIKSEPIEQTEVVSLPQNGDIVIENHFKSITAQYRKLDGTLAAYEGFGSLLPIEKDGTITLYALNDNGELTAATPIRTIDKTIEYNGTQFVLDMEIYGGDIPTALMDDRAVPLVDENHYTIWHETQKHMISPLVVDLTTWEIDDPMANVEFTLPEGALVAHVSVPQNANKVLIRCTMKEGTDCYYTADVQTGNVCALESAPTADWFVCGSEIYCYSDRTLRILNAQYTLETVVENCNYINSTYYVYYNEGENLILLDLRTMQSYEIENGAKLLSNVNHIMPNRSGTKIMISHFALDSNGLSTDAIAIIDLQAAQMYALERKPGMHEKMCGWFDHDRILIAGKQNGEWYICAYKIG